MRRGEEQACIYLKIMSVINYNSYVNKVEKMSPFARIIVQSGGTPIYTVYKIHSTVDQQGSKRFIHVKTVLKSQFCKTYPYFCLNLLENLCI